VNPVRVLSISTLFPSPTRPAFGKFVAAQMAGVAERGDVDLTVINPIGAPPWPLSLMAPYRSLTATPPASELAGLTVHHPRFRLVPRFGAVSNPARIAHALLPMVERLHSDLAFDLIDAQFFFPDGPAAAQIARKLGLPFTIKARGSDIHHWGQDSSALRQMLDAASSAAALLSVSEGLRRDMIALGMPGERIAVHYTGLDRARFRPVDRSEARARIARTLEIPADGPLLVTPGALIAIKGQRLAIESLTALPGARLALAGTGADEAALRDLTTRLGLESRVHMLGQVGHDVLPMLLSAADVMVLPSEREGLANAWVEAIASGTPLVIPDVGGAREVVRVPAAGLIVERSATAIAQGVRTILANPPSQAETAAEAERFSWDANAAQLAAIWRESAAKR
jgi:glycosyltransferase involved in cell wall biosynthesis